MGLIEVVQNTFVGSAFPVPSRLGAVCLIAAVFAVIATAVLRGVARN